MWSALLLLVCVAAYFRNRKRAVIFGAALCCAIGITITNPLYTELWFFATYAGMGTLVFFLVDWKAGSLLCLVSIPGSIHVLGLIDKLQRDVSGEIAFVVALLAAVILGPSRGVSNCGTGFNFGGRDSLDYGRTSGRAIRAEMVEK
ncbi:MAG: hypothetical protein WA790_15805 [Sulfitobacter sp.]